MTLKVNKRTFYILTIALPILIILAAKKFIFFVDSETYLGGYGGIVMKTVVAFYPISTAFLALVNLYCLVKVARSVNAKYFLVFLTQYLFILIFSLTKEQLIFFSIFGYAIFVNKSNFINTGFRVSLIFIQSVRPVYVVQWLLYSINRNVSQSLRLFALILISFLTLLTGLLLIDSFDYIMGVLELRSKVEHTGRDFFNYLCVIQKQNLIEFLPCWLSMFLMLPNHADILSINYIIFLLFQIPNILITGSLLAQFNLKNMIILVIFLSSSILIFWWSPTFGAYLRYFYPMTWLLVAQNYYEISKAVRS